MRRLADLAIVAGWPCSCSSSARAVAPFTRRSSARPSRGGASSATARAGRVDMGRRMIVVLESPSLADRVAAHGGKATEQQEHAWTSSARAAAAPRRGSRSRACEIQPEFSFGRVARRLLGAARPNGRVTARAGSCRARRLSRFASRTRRRSPRMRSKRALASAVGNGDLSLPGYDGRGVTIGLLDTGVDRRIPCCSGASLQASTSSIRRAMRRRRRRRADRVGSSATARRLAGIVAGDRGPTARGVAPDASVLPIRVAGWQSDGSGGLRDLRANGPDHRRPRARSRSERQRRRARCGARRAYRCRGAVRGLRRRSGRACRRRRVALEHARRRPVQGTTGRRTRIRQHLRPGRCARGVDGRRGGHALAHTTDARFAACGLQVASTGCCR